eukprot:SAG31_NODE_539_length_14296_cov_14.408819_6_plen_77_part_00
MMPLTELMLIDEQLLGHPPVSRQHPFEPVSDSVLQLEAKATTVTSTKAPSGTVLLLNTLAMRLFRGSQISGVALGW